MTLRRIVALIAMLLLAGGVWGCGSEPGPADSTERDRPIAAETSVATLSVEGMT